MGISAVFFLLILFVTYLKTPKYRATAKILIRSNPQQQLILFKDLSTPGQDLPAINPASDLIQILTGQEMAQQIVEKFQLDERIKRRKEAPEDLRGTIKGYLSNALGAVLDVVRNLFNAEKAPPNYFAGAVEEFMTEAQNIQLEEKTNVINLSIWEESPALATDIANYMTQLLVQKAIDLEQSSARAAYAFTKEQMKQAETELAAAEKALITFKKENSVISLEEQKQAKLDELENIEQALINVRTAHSEARARLDEMNKKIAAQKRSLSESPTLANNATLKGLVNSLNQVEIELAAELETYTESSESVKTLQAKTLENRDKIAKELRVILQNDSAVLKSIHPDLPNDYARLISEVAAQQAKKKALQQEMEALKAQAFALSEIEAELEGLKRRRETSENLYKTLLEKFSELGVQQISHMSGYDLKIIDKAFVPEHVKPDQPKWLLVLPLGFMVSIMLSVGMVFFVEYWDESFKSATEIEARLEIPVLCTIPEIR